MTPLNEEELRSKVLLPYLQALNIPLPNVILEQSFSVRLGHTVVDIKKREKRKLGGRLDVLVKNSDGDNLFIVELKAPAVKLTEEDVSQGISYARLLDQIAPFVIVTNGQQSHIYDTISKKELTSQSLMQSDFWENSRQLSTQEDLNIRFEALQYFLGYSSENLQEFCKSQRDRGMGALKGVHQNRKFNPQTYVKREGVRAAIKSFIASKSVVFAIVGESGVGKTNELCSLAEELGSENIVLFINATEISETIEKTLANEFNWGFSESIGLPEIARRLAKVGKTLNKRVLICVDSLDESEAINIEQGISELASNISSSQGIIKLIVSVKMSDWPRFSTFRGTISKLHLLLDKSWYTSDPDSDPRPFTLTTFDESEREAAIAAYSKFYGLSAFPDGPIKGFCKHPFLLRVVSELYSGGKEIPLDLSEQQLIDTWIRKKLEQSEKPQVYRQSLTKLAKAIYEESKEKAERKVTYGELWSASSETVFKQADSQENIDIFKGLEAIGLITVQYDHKEVLHYSFYYGPVRDYFIANYIMKFDELTDGDLLHKLPMTLDNSILRSALFWYLRRAPITHTRAVETLISARAKEFIDTYNEILDVLLPKLKHRLPPFTDSEIGVCYKNTGEWLEFAVYPINTTQSSRVEKLKYSMNDRKVYSQLHELQALNLIGGGVNFLNESPRLSAANYALDSVKDAIERGNLNESESITVLQEAVVAIVSSNSFLHNKSRLDKNAFKALPVDLDEIRKEIQMAFGRSSYEQLWVDECVSKQKACNPSQSGFSIPRIPQRRKNEFEDVIAAEVDNDKVFEVPNISEHEELKAIHGLVVQLSSHNRWINKPVLPLTDLNDAYDFEHDLCKYSKLMIEKHVKSFYFKALEAYQVLSKLNFSSITHKLGFCQRFPSTIFVEVNRLDTTRWGVRYAYQSRIGESLSVIVKVDPEKPFIEYSDKGLLIDGDPEDCYSLGATSLFEFFQPSGGPAFNEKQASFTKQMPIRSFVYGIFKNDFEKITADDLLAELSLRATKH